MWENRPAFDGCSKYNLRQRASFGAFGRIFALLFQTPSTRASYTWLTKLDGILRGPRYRLAVGRLQYASSSASAGWVPVGRHSVQHSSAGCGMRAETQGQTGRPKGSEPTVKRKLAGLERNRERNRSRRGSVEASFLQFVCVHVKISNKRNKRIGDKSVRPHHRQKPTP